MLPTFDKPAANVPSKPFSQPVHCKQRQQRLIGLRRPIFTAVVSVLLSLQAASQVSAQGKDLPFCRASTCAGAVQNCTNARASLNLPVAKLPCERFGASCRRTLVFPGNPYSPFPQGCRVTGL